MAKAKAFSAGLGVVFVLGLVSGFALLSGCPGPAGAQTADLPPLEVGASYTFVGHGLKEANIQNRFGATVVQLGPGAWVELEGGDWVNLDQTFHIY